MFEKIENLKYQLNKIKPIPTQELQQLQEDFIIENTYNSNAIEGNTIIRDGLTIERKSLKEHLEILGHKETFDYVFELSKDNNKLLTEKDIRDIHYLVLANDRSNSGRYRIVSVIVDNHTPTVIK